MLILKTGTYNKKNGLTLLELLVVIAILTSLTAIIIPTLSFFEELKIKQEAKKIASIMRFLNDHSITTKETFYLTVNLDKKQFLYTTLEGEIKERFDTLSAVNLQSKGIIRNGEVTIFFHSQGVAEYVSIHLRDQKSEITISVNPLSGKIKIT
ncbi:MAG: type II secretion system GspH family protein [Thermodesulfovibrionales bacterium]|nr:type II secretion system GspH family protein [Thermodesulfovibrionales bacterium]